VLLRELELDEFRSFRRLHLTLGPAGFRLVGANATGKSTVLEAIAMLATMRSPRTSAERELPHWRSGEELAVPPYTRLRGIIARKDGEHTIEIGATIDLRGSGTFSKTIRLDDRPARAVDVVGKFKTVLFSPETVDLLSGSPGNRRRYLDIAISQASRPYLRALSRYTKVLEQRNSLLRALSRMRVPAHATRAGEELAFWDDELVASAVEVVSMRLGAVQALSERASAHYAALTEIDTLAVAYIRHRMPEQTSDIDASHWSSPDQSLRQATSAQLSQAIGEWRAEELRRGVSAVGPHRDDFAVTEGGVDLGRFGSRGQQRLALIALKLAELDLLRGAAGEPPVLLLDDILSELDERHRAKVVSILGSSEAQICITATDADDLRSPELQRLPLLRSTRGAIDVHN
jgi:DNA replication and repair protein RecF